MSDKMCCVVRDLLPLYIEGMTEERSTAFIDRHLAECAACREAHKALVSGQAEDQKRQELLVAGLRRARLRRRIMGWLLAACILIIIAVCVLPVRKTVDREVACLLWRAGDPEKGGQQVTVTLHGHYLDYLFRTDRYEGDLMIEGLEITQRAGAFSGCVLDDSGLLYYADEEALLQSVGFIAATPGMEEFMIGLYEKQENGIGTWNSENGAVLTSSAENREQAVTLTRQILRKTQNRLAGLSWEAGVQP